jgi:hypothetical protein
LALTEAWLPAQAVDQLPFRLAHTLGAGHFFLLSLVYSRVSSFVICRHAPERCDNAFKIAAQMNTDGSTEQPQHRQQASTSRRWELLRMFGWELLQMFLSVSTRGSFVSTRCCGYCQLVLAEVAAQAAAAAAAEQQQQQPHPQQQQNLDIRCSS